MYEHTCPVVQRSFYNEHLTKSEPLRGRRLRLEGEKGFHSMFPETWIFFHSLNNVEIDEELGPSPLYHLKITRERERALEQCIENQLQRERKRI